MIRRSYGSVAHLGERLHGMEEVASSILVGSTINARYPKSLHVRERVKIEIIQARRALNYQQMPMKALRNQGFSFISRKNVNFVYKTGPSSNVPKKRDS